jgi:hypothetical protein
MHSRTGCSKRLQKGHKTQNPPSLKFLPFSRPNNCHHLLLNLRDEDLPLAMVSTNKPSPKPSLLPLPHKNALLLLALPPLVIRTSRGGQICQLAQELCSGKVRLRQAQTQGVSLIEWVGLRHGIMLGLEATSTKGTRYRRGSTILPVRLPTKQ